ncbi:MAG: TolC family protein, partial [Syntrophothermus sp.]
MKKCKFFLLLVLSCTTVIFQPVSAQEKIHHLTLEQALEIARTNSPDALNAKQAFRSSFWQYKTYRGTYLPNLTFDATVPDLQRAFQLNHNLDGSVTYVPYQYVNYTADLSLTQRVGFTGGTLFLRSGLQRLDNITDTTITSYLTTPLNIGYTQPIFKFNPYKWERKLEPLKYEVSKKKYLEDLEQINITTTNYFFN